MVCFEHSEYGDVSSGQVPKWTKGADCKSVAGRLPRFESLPAHHPGAQRRSRGLVTFEGRGRSTFSRGWLSASAGGAQRRSRGLEREAAGEVPSILAGCLALRGNSLT